jgi:hypothetical protein
MVTYAYLSLGGYPLASTEDFVDPTAMMLFSEKDKRIRMPEPDEVDHDPVDGEEVEAMPEVEYVASLVVVKDRLEFMGYTLAKAQAEFQQGLEEHIKDKYRFLEYATEHIADSVARLEAEVQLLKSTTFTDWVHALAFIFSGKHYPGFHYRDREKAEEENLPPLVRYLLSESPGEGVWTPFSDFRLSVRAAIEVTGLEPELIYDVSELVAEQTIDPDDDLCEWARRQTAEEFILNHKVIVLTEGKSDKWTIEGALHLLYPHLSDYYSFMDFDLARVEGGAGALVTVIKAFVGAGIVNRTIALFDNDTAARAALRGLRDVKLPANVRVVHLPDVEWAKRYPTLGPQGLVDMDVNGLAGSVELYFGLDVLRQNDGTLTPVQWRGYEMSLNQYQGEVINKSKLQDLYSEKMAKCREDSSEIANHDWEGMKAIIDVIRTAFHDSP